MTSRPPTRVFYAVVLVIALAGATDAAAGEWLRWPLVLAAGAVAAVELGGVVLSVHADHRRQLGERATAARVLSAAVALGAVAVNWFGHQHIGQAAFFAGMSALGYAVWLIDSGSRRRDALRAAGRLAHTAPAYGLAQWLRRPGLTRRAHARAIADPNLGRQGSLDAARAEIADERRHKAMAKILHRMIRASAPSPTHADLAIETYPLDEIARRVAAAADLDGLAARIAADLTPAAITAGGGSPVAWDEDEEPLTLAELMAGAGDSPAPVSPAAPGDRSPSGRAGTPAVARRPRPLAAAAGDDG